MAGLLVGLVITFSVAGCGSSSLSHAALVKQANQACRQADAKVSALGVPTATLAKLKRYARDLLPISRHLAITLSALKPSTADKPALARLVSSVENGNQGLALMAKAGSTSQASQAAHLIAAKSVPEAADALGAGNCASAPSA